MQLIPQQIRSRRSMQIVGQQTYQLSELRARATIAA
jgi:hypothetical protein